MDMDTKNNLDIMSQSQQSQDPGDGGEGTITLQVQDQGGDTVR